ncbi:membrane protein YczE [Micromonospora fluostatini]|uniref:membrane protein YczE n=1 Tax=Micromonospora sp. JCM 30529 TaxID=3421643 RepID=UPI003D16FDD3
MAPTGNLRYRPARRLVQLYLGLVLYGTSMAMMIRSDLGLNPWDVFHQGLSMITGMSIGAATIVTGILVLLLWIPLRLRPGLGTVSNVLVIGVVVDLALALLPTGMPLAARIGLLVVGIVGNGLATGLYLGARFGPGPRDGLMSGYVARRPGRSIRLVRTVIEVTVLALGWLLGGTVGIGTVAYALAIGPLAQVFIPMFTVAPPAGPDTGTPGGQAAGTSRGGTDPSGTRPHAASAPQPAAPQPAAPQPAAPPVG